MKSYLEIISKDETFALCEVEMIPVGKSNKKEYVTSQVKMTYVHMSKFCMVNGTIDEGDVFIVLHNSGRVIRVCERDIEEKSKRRALKKRGVATV